MAGVPDGWTRAITWQRGIGSSSYIVYPVAWHGRTAIKLEPDPAYIAKYRCPVTNEINSAFLPFKPGDHVVLKMWLWVESSTAGDNRNAYAGAMMGIDVYGNGRICGLTTPDGKCAWPDYSPAYTQNIVPFGTQTWIQKNMDFIVQNTYTADPYNPPGGHAAYEQVVPNGMIATLNIYTHHPTTEQASVYIADVELYINPAPTPTPTTSPSPIIGDSYAITNENDATLLTAIYPSSTNARSAGGQCFRGLAGYKLTSARFALSKIGNPSGNLVATLYALTGTFGTNGRPTGTALAASKTVAMSSVSGWTMTMVNFTFPQPYTLSNGYYCLAIQASSGSLFSGGNCILIGYDNSSPTHGGNYFIYANNGWTGYQSLDGCFSVSLTP